MLLDESFVEGAQSIADDGEGLAPLLVREMGSLLEGPPVDQDRVVDLPKGRLNGISESDVDLDVVASHIALTYLRALS
jgi:hypothetical protein